MEADFRSRKTKLIIAGFLLPGILQVGIVLLLAFFKHPGATRDDGSFTISLMIISIVTGALIFSLGAFDKFWKVHLFACLAATLPVSIVFVATLLIKGERGYFWLGLVSFVFMFTISFLLSGPFTGLTYTVLKSRRSGASVT